VISRVFFFFLLHNHIINIKKYFSFSGDVNYEANFSFFILLYKRATPIAPPYVHFSYPNLLSTFANLPIYIYRWCVTVIYIYTYIPYIAGA
jgi:hypothetical protein